MSLTLLAVQTLNGLQLGVLLFLIAAGLTLVFGVMDFINIAHGSQFMAGAYFAVAGYSATDSFLGALLVALGGSLALGLVLELLVARHLYGRDHLAQVLATLGVLLFLNEAARAVFGATPLSLPVPDLLSGSIALMDGLLYPVYRVALLLAGLAVAALLYVLVQHTRFGMLIRAGATNAPMVSALGVDVGRLFLMVFAFGSMLAGFAGLMAAPLLSVHAGMGDNLLILAFVVIVIGGLGSIKGAFVGALLVGLVDTLGRSFATDLFRLFLPPAAANDMGPAVASMLIYVLMAAVLFLAPAGLFGASRA
jgi:branched-chain amino acid transport system permease protein